MTARHDEGRHRFEIERAGQVAAAEYRRDGRTLVLTHTEVPPAQRGHGIGDQLARAAFEFARKNDLKVEPDCRFMAAWLRRHPEYQDLEAG